MRSLKKLKRHKNKILLNKKDLLIKHLKQEAFLKAH